PTWGIGTTEPSRPGWCLQPWPVKRGRAPSGSHSGEISMSSAHARRLDPSECEALIRALDDTPGTAHQAGSGTNLERLGLGSSKGPIIAGPSPQFVFEDRPAGSATNLGHP